LIEHRLGRRQRACRSLREPLSPSGRLGREITVGDHLVDQADAVGLGCGQFLAEEEHLLGDVERHLASQ
jgi:hypothetical protein